MTCTLCFHLFYDLNHNVCTKYVRTCLIVFYQCASLITYILVGGCLEVHLATFLYLLTMVAFTLVLSILIVLSGFRIFLVVKVQFFSRRT